MNKYTSRFKGKSTIKTEALQILGESVQTQIVNPETKEGDKVEQEIAQPDVVEPNQKPKIDI